MCSAVFSVSQKRKLSHKTYLFYSGPDLNVQLSCPSFLCLGLVTYLQKHTLPPHGDGLRALTASQWIGEALRRSCLEACSLGTWFAGLLIPRFHQRDFTRDHPFGVEATHIKLCCSDMKKTWFERNCYFSFTKAESSYKTGKSGLGVQSEQVLLSCLARSSPCLLRPDFRHEAKTPATLSHLIVNFTFSPVFGKLQEEGALSSSILPCSPNPWHSEAASFQEDSSKSQVKDKPILSPRMEHKPNSYRCQIGCEKTDRAHIHTLTHSHELTLSRTFSNSLISSHLNTHIHPNTEPHTDTHWHTFKHTLTHMQTLKHVLTQVVTLHAQYHFFLKMSVTPHPTLLFPVFAR